ncbi:unnamed protein product [Withania somnifera]
MDNHASSQVGVLIRQQESPQEELSINKYSNISPSSLPLLSIRFHLRTYERCCRCRPPHDPKQFQYDQPTLANSLNVDFSPLIYTSYNMFYNAIQENLANLGEEFENDYGHIIIHDIIGKVYGIVDDESNKDRQKLKVFVGVIFRSYNFLDENILTDDCVICFEELGNGSDLRYTPCSHVFHEDCVARWLENGHSCPICRYDLS